MKLILLLLLSGACLTACNKKKTCSIADDTENRLNVIVGPRCDLAFTIDKDSNLVIYNEKEFIKWFYKTYNQIQENNELLDQYYTELVNIGRWASNCEVETRITEGDFVAVGHGHSKNCHNHKHQPLDFAINLANNTSLIIGKNYKND